MKELLSYAGRLVRQFPRTHLLLSMALLGGVILIALRPDSPPDAPRQQAKTITLPAKPVRKPEPASQPQAPQTPQWHTLTVKPGDSLSSLLQPLGVGAGQVFALINSDDKLKRLTKIRPGETLQVTVDDDDRLTRVQYHPSKVETLTASLRGGGWETRLSQREYQKQTRFAEADITDSLFLAGAAAGISDKLTMQLANLFAWDVDFVLDIRRGDRFRIVYDQVFESTFCLLDDRLCVGDVL